MEGESGLFWRIEALHLERLRLSTPLSGTDNRRDMQIIGNNRPSSERCFESTSSLVRGQQILDIHSITTFLPRSLS